MVEETLAVGLSFVWRAEGSRQELGGPDAQDINSNAIQMSQSCVLLLPK